MISFLALLPHGMDYVWIFALFVLMFGANKLPSLARGLGKSIGEFKKAKQEFEAELHNSLKEEPKPPVTTHVSPAPAQIPGTVAKTTISNPDISKLN